MDQEKVIEILHTAQITQQQAEAILRANYDAEWGYTLPQKLFKYLKSLAKLGFTD